MSACPCGKPALVKYCSRKCHNKFYAREYRAKNRERMRAYQSKRFSDPQKRERRREINRQSRARTVDKRKQRYHNDESYRQRILARNRKNWKNYDPVKLKAKKDRCNARARQKQIELTYVLSALAVAKAARKHDYRGAAPRASVHAVHDGAEPPAPSSGRERAGKSRRAPV